MSRRLTRDREAASAPVSAEDLISWVRAVLEPLGQVPAAHHLCLLDALGALDRAEHDRLMVLMPPGSAKSTFASVLFPAWFLARHPRCAVIAASHTAQLAEHFGRRVRSVLREHGAALGVALATDSRAAGRFETDQAAEYFAAGVHGPITGRRADLAIIDDPVKSWAEADSATAREHVWDWYRAELMTRLKPRGRVVLIMTRWHEDDLGGRLLAAAETGGDRWQVLRFPALAGAADPLGRAPGEPLWPEWETAAALARKRAAMGERAFAALYQQSPRPEAGGLISLSRLARVDAAPARGRIVRAWDLAATAASAGRDPDWTVGVKLMEEDAGRYIVLDVVRLRGAPAEVERALLATAEADGRSVAIGLPQDPGQAGRAQILYLTRRLAGFVVRATPETGSKLVRAMPAAAQIDAGNVALLRAPWNQAFVEELRDFPHGVKDDQVDALARAFAMLTTQAPPARRISVPLFAR